MLLIYCICMQLLTGCISLVDYLLWVQGCGSSLPSELRVEFPDPAEGNWIPSVSDHAEGTQLGSVVTDP